MIREDNEPEPPVAAQYRGNTSFHSFVTVFEGGRLYPGVVPTAGQRQAPAAFLS